MDYESKSRILTMTFINRPRWIYTYYNVPKTIWTGLIKAQSKGEYFSNHIRDRFRYERIVM